MRLQKTKKFMKWNHTECNSLEKLEIKTTFSLYSLIVSIIWFFFKNGNCHYDAKNIGATDTGFVDVKSGDEDALKTAVATVGPIAVAIDASHFSFQFYHSGVYNSWLCSSTRLDHGVLAVGYGNYQGKDYWLVKNRYAFFVPLT